MVAYPAKKSEGSMMSKSEYEKIPPYRTKDGSTIRELIHPSRQGADVSLSLAEAEVPPGQETFLHLHRNFQEAYHFTKGEGLITLGDETFPVKAGDSVLIPQKTPHKVRNTGTSPLRILCCCAPPYTHEATELLESD
jgi:mannose-6-phosphate isomerase-like protein (cupin superfamily)